MPQKVKIESVASADIDLPARGALLVLYILWAPIGGAYAEGSPPAERVGEWASESGWVSAGLVRDFSPSPLLLLLLPPRRQIYIKVLGADVKPRSLSNPYLLRRSAGLPSEIWLARIWCTGQEANIKP
ncbi:hypothetical protein EDC01DRAFT_655771 [Geopyxis carbonaria]|nr:hypothetical protein EDC01DRAFT_655771 [Geopyxis carbonaria]